MLQLARCHWVWNVLKEARRACKGYCPAGLRGEWRDLHSDAGFNPCSHLHHDGEKWHLQCVSLSYQNTEVFIPLRNVISYLSVLMAAQSTSDVVHVQRKDRGKPLHVFAGIRDCWMTLSRQKMKE